MASPKWNAPQLSTFTPALLLEFPPSIEVLWLHPSASPPKSPQWRRCRDNPATSQIFTGTEPLWELAMRFWRAAPATSLIRGEFGKRGQGRICSDPKDAVYYLNECWTVMFSSYSPSMNQRASDLAKHSLTYSFPEFLMAHEEDSTFRQISNRSSMVTLLCQTMLY